MMPEAASTPPQPNYTENATGPCWPKPRQSVRHQPKKASHWKPGKIARSKSRNLLERLIKFEDAVLRFMDDPLVPFTNNQAENDLRMIKIQQKVSGCFRSMDGAKVFCHIRGYLTTCRKQGVSAAEALTLLFQGKWPAFMYDSI
jgi:transposase